MRVRVQHLFEACDMRYKRELIECDEVKSLRRGQCVLAVNGRATLARLIDWTGGLHEWRAPEGETFDLEAIAVRMRIGLGVELEVSGWQLEPIAA